VGTAGDGDRRMEARMMTEGSLDSVCAGDGAHPFAAHVVPDGAQDGPSDRGNQTEAEKAAQTRRNLIECLVRVEQEQSVDRALARGTLAARRCIEAARAKLERGPNFAVYDLEDHAWAMVAEEPDLSVLAVERQEALRAAEEESGDSGMGGGPCVSAIWARYALAADLGDVLAALQRRDPRDMDEIVSDLRARLGSDGGTVEGARHALRGAVARHRHAVAARLAAEASDPPREEG
jgi:hypothetical protein